MTPSDAYASFDHPSRNPVSLQALFVGLASTLKSEDHAMIERILSDSQKLLSLVGELLGETEQTLTSTGEAPLTL